jgi:ribosomal protein L37AE/L43A
MTNNLTNKLECFDAKDCPFCGSDEVSYGYSYPPMVGVVECHACDAVLTGPTEAEAVAAWNAQEAARAALTPSPPPTQENAG